MRTRRCGEPGCGPSLGGPLPALCRPTGGVLHVCVRAHEHVPTSLTCPSSVHHHRPPPHVQLLCHPEENRWRGTGTHRPGANSGLHGHEMTSARTGCSPRLQAGDSAHRGRGPRSQMHAHSGRGLPLDSLKAANGLLPWKTKDVQRPLCFAPQRAGRTSGLPESPWVQTPIGPQAPSAIKAECRPSADSCRQDSQFCPRGSRYGSGGCCGNRGAF